MTKVNVTGVDNVLDWKVEESDVNMVDVAGAAWLYPSLLLTPEIMSYMPEQHKPKEWITTTQATSYLGVSSKTMSRLIRDGVIRTYSHPLDRRKKLVRLADVTKLKEEAERVAA